MRSRNRVFKLRSVNVELENCIENQRVVASSLPQQAVLSRQRQALAALTVRKACDERTPLTGTPR